jgi:hypothetical protein
MYLGAICKMTNAQSKMNESSSFLRHFQDKCLVHWTHVLNAGKTVDVPFLNNRDAETSAFCSVMAAQY